MIKKRYLILIILLSFFMISQVSANDDLSQINGCNYGDLEFRELSPIDTSLDHYYVVIDINTDFFYYPIRDYPEENLTEEITIDSTANLNPDKINPEFNISMINRTADGNATLILNANPNATGFVVFSFLENKEFNLTDGSLIYDFTNLEKGKYSFDFYYSGDETFANGTYNDIIFSIPSFNTTIVPKIENFTIYYRNGTSFAITLLDDLGRPLKDKTVKFRINNQIYTKETDLNGEARLAINLNPGDYLMEVAFDGFPAISGCSYNTTLTVLPTLKADDLVKIYKNDSQFLVKALDRKGNILVNKSIQFNINGVFYNRTTNESGIAKLNINLHPGDYIITSKNLEDGFQISNTITVLPSIISENLVKIYKNDSQFFVRLIDGNRSPLSNAKLRMNIHGVIYERTTDSQGNAKLNINLEPGDYIITTENLKDGCMISNNIKVTPYLFTEDLVKFYKNDSQFEAKLVDSSYNPISNQVITFEINGVKYDRTTNEAGIATLKINLAPGYYDIVSTNGEYRVSNQIKVLTTILTPNNYAKGEFTDWINYNPNPYGYSVHGPSHYPVKILDGKGNPYANQSVTFNVDGKNYQRTTNVDGIATIDAIPVDHNYYLITTYYNGYFVQQNVIKMG